MQNVVCFDVKKDTEMVILEIENGKGVKDSEPTTLRCLLKEFEETEIIDVTVCCHNLSKKSAMEGALTV